MDFATAPCIQRMAHGVFGYSRWQNEAFLGAIAHWYASRFNSVIDPQTVVYGPSVIYMVAETIRQWSQEGDGVVVHTPTMRFITPLTADRSPRTDPDEQSGTAIWRAGSGAGGAEEYPAAAVQPAQPNGESLAPRGAPDHGGAVPKAWRQGD
jgi:hypothetical protein